MVGRIEAPAAGIGFDHRLGSELEHSQICASGGAVAEGFEPSEDLHPHALARSMPHCAWPCVSPSRTGQRPITYVPDQWRMRMDESTNETEFGVRSE